MFLTKRLLHHNSAVILGAIDNRGRDEVSWSFGILPSHRDIVLLSLDIAEEGLDPLVLHGVLDRPEEDILFVPLAHLQSLGVRDHGIPEWLEDLLVHNDAFEGEADLYHPRSVILQKVLGHSWRSYLARIEKSKSGNLLQTLVLKFFPVRSLGHLPWGPLLRY